ncbi:MAG: hypothetical protein LBG64_03030 [Pseudomonadales bacterium]|jgi:hypothetical protein|nr:hypothetical protein [Pseudomonadales bacterium]
MSEQNMNEQIALEIVDKIFLNVFGQKNNLSLDEVMEKFAFDVPLPQKVQDGSGATTWTLMNFGTKFITQEEQVKKDSWMLPKREISGVDELVEIWRQTNLITTERVFDSVNVIKSDCIYGCENVFHSSNSNGCKNIVFCDGCHGSTHILACQRSGNMENCIRVDDSANCSNSYNIICSGKISNSLVIQDCNSLHECIFCSHISDKRYCIANMQFEKEEYFALKKKIIDWILKN